MSCQINDSEKKESKKIVTDKVERVNFKGFCDLKIGETFESIPSFNKFKKADSESYYAESYEISKNIGTVLFVSVMLKEGKIDKVGFTSGSILNKNKLDSCFNSYKSKELNLPCSTETSKSFKSNDEVVITTLILDSEYLFHMYGYNPINYFYFDSTGLNITE